MSQFATTIAVSSRSFQLDVLESSISSQLTVNIYQAVNIYSWLRNLKDRTHCLLGMSSSLSHQGAFSMPGLSALPALPSDWKQHIQLPQNS